MNAILSLLQPLDRYRTPSTIGSAIGRPLSRPILHPNTGGSAQPHRSKPLGGAQPRDSGTIVSKPFKTSAKKKRDRGRDSQPHPRPRLNSQPQGATKPRIRARQKPININILGGRMCGTNRNRLGQNGTRPWEKAGDRLLGQTGRSQFNSTVNSPFCPVCSWDGWGFVQGTIVPQGPSENSSCVSVGFFSPPKNGRHTEQAKSGTTRAPTRAPMEVDFLCFIPCKSSHETSHEGAHGSAHESVHSSGRGSLVLFSPVLFLDQRMSGHELFAGGIPEQKFNVNRACFPKEKHQNS